MNDIEMILRSRIEELERRLLESQARVHAAEARLRAVADALLEDVASQQGGAK